MDDHSGFEWFIIVRYTVDNWCGDMIDAIYALDSMHALHYVVDVLPKKPGDCFRAIEADTQEKQYTAIKLYHERRRADREWKLLVAEMENGWLSASQHECNLNLEDN